MCLRKVKTDATRPLSPIPRPPYAKRLPLSAETNSPSSYLLSAATTVSTLILATHTCPCQQHWLWEHKEPQASPSQWPSDWQVHEAPVDALNMQILKPHTSPSRLWNEDQKPHFLQALNEVYVPELEKYSFSRILWNTGEKMKASKDMMTHPRPQSWSVVKPSRTLSFWPKVTTQITTQMSEFSDLQASAYSPMLHYLTRLTRVLCTKMEQNLREIRFWGKNSLKEH